MLLHALSLSLPFLLSLQMPFHFILCTRRLMPVNKHQVPKFKVVSSVKFKMIFSWKNYSFNEGEAFICLYLGASFYHLYLNLILVILSQNKQTSIKHKRAKPWKELYWPGHIRILVLVLFVTPIQFERLKAIRCPCIHSSSNLKLCLNKLKHYCSDRFLRPRNFYMPCIDIYFANDAIFLASFDSFRFMNNV